MKRLLPLIALLCISCSAKYKPEILHPTQERLEELMRLTKPPVEYKSDFEVVVYPSFIFERGSVRVRCLVPASFQNGRTMRFGVENKEMSEAPADHYEFVRLYQNMECGTWKASCTLSDGTRREKDLLVKGTCNDEDRDK